MDYSAQNNVPRDICRILALMDVTDNSELNSVAIRQYFKNPSIGNEIALIQYFPTERNFYHSRI